MSVETQGGSTADQSLTLRRNEGIQTVERTMPQPARHGAAGMFVLNDADRDAAGIPWAAGEQRQLPDGSLYQHARAARYAHEDNLVEDPGGRKRAVLSREYEIDDEEHAVIMTDSRWRAGTGQDEDYRAWYKYDLKLRPLDPDGSIAWSRTPVEALNLKLQPQYEQLVDPDGKPLSLPYNEGTLVHVQSTWVDRPRELLERTQQLVEEALGYELSESFVHPESRRFWKAEVHHRVDSKCEADLVHTLRQSQDLLAQHAADVETEGTHKGNTWLKAKVTTREWEQLGFPNIDAQILLKVYYPDNPDAEYPFNQPKIEAALAGNPGGEALHWDQWDEVMQVLEEITLSHLLWAGIGATDLIEDDYSDGPFADPCDWQHPQGRRHWLREHYESLVPELYREATKPHTTLVYDILDCVRRYGTVTYERLMEETGAAYRTVRQHVTRLCEEVGGNEPGILEKVQDAVTFIAFSSRFFEDHADEALNQVLPDDTPEQREQRAEERRERREERQAHDDKESEDTAADDAQAEERSTWRYFDQIALTPEQLADALDEEFLPADHVRVRVDASPLFGCG